MYFGLALWNAGEANWTAPATVSLGILTVALWHERARDRRWARNYSIAALATGVVMSLAVLNTDVLRAIGIPWSYEVDPGSRLRGWRTTAETVENFRKDFEQKQGAPVFLIANKYQTAAALSFYMKEPRVEGSGHPPVYIPESQAIENQFSFWPRYDELVDLRQVGREVLAKPPAHLTPAQLADITRTLKALPAEDQAHTADAADLWREYVRALTVARPDLLLDESFVEQHGINLFAGRSALYVTDRTEERPPSSIKSGFERVEMIACIDIHRRGQFLRQIRIFACHNYRGGMSL
jgi:hypothetical protein